MKNMRMDKNKALSFVLLGTAPFIFASKPNTHKQPNVLFIIVDDLRTELNCYGNTEIISPNIDKLAASGVQFNQAYCNIAASGASRASLMTGMRPTKYQFLDAFSKISVEAPNAIPLPKLFKQKGYTTLSNSKVIHYQKDVPDAWSEIWMPGAYTIGWRNYLGYENQKVSFTKQGPDAFECLDVADNAYYDGMTAEKAINDLQKFKKSGNPFFLCVGFVKPHLPFNAPKRYWDMYPLDKITLPDSYRMDRSTFPSQAFWNWDELRFYNKIPDQGPIESDVEARKLIQGYRACVSYSDAQVGKVMDELKRLKLDENTLVVLIGDHGWSLGNHGEWCKWSSFSVVNRTPLIVSGLDIPSNKKVNKIVEFVDLYPSICEMAGLEIPKQVEGKSFVKLVKESDDPEWKNAAVIQNQGGLTYMTPEYRYTEWSDSTNKVVAKMLFDYKNDSNELKNIATDKKNKKLIELLHNESMKLRGKDYFSKLTQ
jgi:arylsulfatase A-like enzyme